MHVNVYTYAYCRYINFLAEMVESDKNPSDGRKQAIQQEKKIVVYSPRGKLSQKYLKNDLYRLQEYTA